MSSTRYAPNGADLSQQRWASNPDYSTSVSALMAAKRIALLDDQSVRDLLWFIQWRSLQPRGLRRLAEELLSGFPERLSTPAMRKLRLRPGRKLSRSQTSEVRKDFRDAFLLYREEVEILESLVERTARVAHDAPRFYKTDHFFAVLREDAQSLHKHLMQLCVNPDIRFDRLNPSWSEPSAAGVWYFDDLIGALKQIRSKAAGSVEIMADTEANRQINSALDFCYRRRRMILIEGKAGIGKSEAAKAWCNRTVGLARYIEIPAGVDERSFFATIAASIGVARGGSYNGQQIKLRVEDALRASGLMLVLDEAQFLWPQQYDRPRGSPSRIQWIKTLFDAGTPIALVALPKFSQWQKLYAEKTLWDQDQLERRLNRKIILPDAHSKRDLMEIARVKHPNGDKACWTLLTGYALASTRKQASAISEAMESAIDIAQQKGRGNVTYDDIEAAIQLDFKPIANAAKTSGKTRVASRLQSRCRPDSERLQSANRLREFESLTT